MDVYSCSHDKHTLTLEQLSQGMIQGYRKMLVCSISTLEQLAYLRQQMLLPFRAVWFYSECSELGCVCV